MRVTPLALMLVASTLAGCGSSNGGGGGPSNPPPADVVIVPGAATKGFQAFNPDTFTVSLAAGGTVTWRNGENVSHTVTDTATVPAFNLSFGATDDTASTTFTVAGQYGYRCNIHPGMRGLVIVTP